MADQLIRATAAEGGIRAVGVMTTQLTQEARRRHKLSDVAVAALGRTMSASLLLASSMKQPQARVTIRVRSEGELGLIFADAGTDGTVRGYVDNPNVQLPPNADGEPDIAKAVGHEGFLHVLKDVGYGQPYSSTVELVTGAINEDVSYYLSSSEQTPSALLSGVYVDRTGVTAAGGLLLQIMPKAARDDSLIAVLESRVSGLSSFGRLLNEGKSLEEILQDVLGDLSLEILPKPQTLRFQCRCSFDRVLGALKMLGEAELKDMIVEDQGAEAICHFCAEVYHADSNQLEQIILKLKAEAIA